MSISVNDALSTPAAAASASSLVPAPAATAPTTSGFVLSTVDLSENAQALALQEQGQSPSEIAQTLGISVAAVDGYLGITVPAVAPTPVPVQATPTTQGAPSNSAAPGKS